jgi:hypothetical protein
MDQERINRKLSDRRFDWGPGPIDQRRYRPYAKPVARERARERSRERSTTPVYTRGLTAADAAAFMAAMERPASEDADAGQLEAIWAAEHVHHRLKRSCDQPKRRAVAAAAVIAGATIKLERFDAVVMAQPAVAAVAALPAAVAVVAALPVPLAAPPPMPPPVPMPMPVAKGAYTAAEVQVMKDSIAMGDTTTTIAGYLGRSVRGVESLIGGDLVYQIMGDAAVVAAIKTNILGGFCAA